MASAIGAIPTCPDPLDFTPVQQGTGIDQLSNIVKIGWTAKQGLKATVDETDQGSFVFQAALNAALADKVSGGPGIRLKWDGRDGQPYWLLGGNSASNDVALYRPAALSVNYATSASYAQQLVGAGLVEGTIDSYRLNKNHTTPELAGAWQLRGFSYDVGSGGDGNIGTRTCLWQRVG